MKVKLMLFFGLFLLSNFLKSQNDWEFLSDQTGRYGDCNINEEGAIILSSGFAGKVYKLDSQGNLLWLKNVCDCEDEIIATSVETGNNIVHLTKNGRVYHTDLEGDNSEYITNITGDTLLDRLFGYIRDVIVLDSNIYFIGEFQLDGISYTIRGKYNFISIISDYEIEESYMSPVSVSYNSSHGIMGLFIFGEEKKLRLYDQGMNVIKDTTLIIEESIRNVVTDDTGFYLLGYDGDFSNANGLLYRLNYDFEIEWSRVYIPTEMDFKIFYINGIVREENLYICGSIGYEFNMASYFVKMNSAGDVLQSNRLSLTAEGNYAQKILPTLTETDQFILAGLANVIDVGGTSIPYVYKINTSSISSTEENNESCIRAYPNPTNGKVYVESRYEYDWVRVYNVTGQLVKEEIMNGYELYLNDLPSGVYFVNFIKYGRNEEDNAILRILKI